MITEQLSRIEEDLTIVCSHVPINDNATLDILGHDENGQLAIIQLSTTEDDIMLLHAIQSMDYVDKFKSFLKATYNKHKIDDQEKPRLILVAPSFSDAVRKAAESMKGIRIDLYEWEYLRLGDQKGIHFQHLLGVKTERPKETKEYEKKHEQKSKKKEQWTNENQDQPRESEAAPSLEPTNPEVTEPELPPPVDEGTPKRKLKLF